MWINIFIACKFLLGSVTAIGLYALLCSQIYIWVIILCIEQNFRKFHKGKQQNWFLLVANSRPFAHGRGDVTRTNFASSSSACKIILSTALPSFWWYFSSYLQFCLSRACYSRYKKILDTISAIVYCFQPYWRRSTYFNLSSFSCLSISIQTS